MNFVIHWNETAMGLQVFPIPIGIDLSRTDKGLQKAKNSKRNPRGKFILDKSPHRQHLPMLLMKDTLSAFIWENISA